MKYKYYTCDVFTNSRFGGNPLGVLVDARGLSTEQMQLIAREFNYSESTFLLPAEAGHTAKMRIFTRQKELPFAGHPNVGTAFVMAATGMLGEFGPETEITLEEAAGLVPIKIRNEGDGMFWCELKAPQPLSLMMPVEPARIAKVLSLSPDDIAVDHHPPRMASVGLPYFITELKSRAALEKVEINLDALRELTADAPRDSVYVYTRSKDEFDIRARMFAPLGGTPEDPATGSATCAMVGMVTHYYSETDGEFSFHIAQGVEMGRPSILDARTQKINGEVTGVWIAGQSVMVFEGELTI